MYAAPLLKMIIELQKSHSKYETLYGNTQLLKNFVLSGIFS